MLSERPRTAEATGAERARLGVTCPTGPYRPFSGMFHQRTRSVVDLDT